jgi:hypothetical protein
LPVYCFFGVRFTCFITDFTYTSHIILGLTVIIIIIIIIIIIT